MDHAQSGREPSSFQKEKAVAAQSGRGDEKQTEKISVGIAGATGWAASALCRAIVQTSDLLLVTALARKTAGQDLRKVLDIDSEAAIPITDSMEIVLDSGIDVLLDYTSPVAARGHVSAAIERKIPVVIGTSGLSDEDYLQIDRRAKENNIPVLAVGNFAMSAVLLNKFASIAARYMPSWEIIDYAGDQKPDAPSGTALELAGRLSKVRKPLQPVPVSDTLGYPGTRGETMHGMQVHAVRLPGYVLSVESIFGLPDEKLVIRHEAGSSAVPYIEGALLALRRLAQRPYLFTGLKRGLDSIMDWDSETI